jgi:hypothetical protein
VPAQHEIAAQRVAERLDVGTRQRDFLAGTRDRAQIGVDARGRAERRRPGAARR